MESVEIPVKVWIVEIVIEKEDGEIDIRVTVELVAVVFSDTGEKTVLKGIGNKWVSACERYIVKLLRGRDAVRGVVVERSLLDTGSPEI